MGKFDKKYDIRLARYEDITKIMEFIDQNWKKNHILARDRDFFEYEFLEEDGTVNVLIAVDKEKKTIEAMQGILRASHDSKNLDIWGCCWKVKPNNMPMLGFEVWRQSQILTKARYQLGCGANPHTSRKILKVMMRSELFKMNHYYILNKKFQEKFCVAKITKFLHSNHSLTNKHDVQMIVNERSLEDSYGYIDNTDFVPYKDIAYIKKRYFNHPYYNYEVYKIVENERVLSIFVIRIQEYKGNYVARLVDYIGDEHAISQVGYFFDNYIDRKKCEYIDFYNYGIDKEILKTAGFVLKKEEDGNIIPNYFNPFVQENIDIWIYSPCNKAVFCKADGDQDRPS